MAVYGPQIQKENHHGLTESLKLSLVESQQLRERKFSAHARTLMQPFNPDKNSILVLPSQHEAPLEYEAISFNTGVINRHCSIAFESISHWRLNFSQTRIYLYAFIVSRFSAIWKSRIFLTKAVPRC